MQRGAAQIASGKDAATLGSGDASTNDSGDTNMGEVVTHERRSEREHSLGARRCMMSRLRDNA